MKTLLLFLLVGVVFAGNWESVQKIPSGQAIEVVTRDGAKTRASFVSADANALSFRDHSATRSFQRAEIRRVRVYSPSRRVIRGVLWMGIGAASGALAGVAACPYCSNEGHTSKYIAPGAAAGAGIGALGFLSSPYRTIYKSK